MSLAKYLTGVVRLDGMVPIGGKSMRVKIGDPIVIVDTIRDANGLLLIGVSSEGAIFSIPAHQVKITVTKDLRELLAEAGLTT
jgi:hypothetical protein